MTGGARLTTIGWGLFCACSWTWVIGMYLPRIMVQRDGWAGFLVFAIPNVIGCAGFGYVLATRARSDRLIARHSGAMTAFSVVAIGFHVLFWSILADAGAIPGLDGPVLPWLVPAGVWAVGLGLASFGNRVWLGLSVAVYALSLAIFGVYAAATTPPLPTASTGADLLWLAPVITIGFLLCPYLDLTFHRALRLSPSPHAFFVFGITFSVMLVLTVLIWFASSWRGMATAHLLAQSVFTVGAHLREIRTIVPCANGTRRVGLLLAPLLALPVYPIARALIESARLGDELYLRYLVAYGLVFPAYVLLFMGPWRPLPVTGRWLLIVAGCVVVPLLPLYEAGFLHGWSVGLLVVPVGVAVWGTVRSRGARAA